MGAVTVRVDADGTLAIPKGLRERSPFGISEGGELRLVVEDGGLRGSTRLAAFPRLERKLAALAPPEDETSAVDERIADRRAEAMREEAAEQAWEEAQRRRKPAG